MPQGARVRSWARGNALRQTVKVSSAANVSMICDMRKDTVMDAWRTYARFGFCRESIEPFGWAAARTCGCGSRKTVVRDRKNPLPCCVERRMLATKNYGCLTRNAWPKVKARTPQWR
jgi:hypothetical protein